MKIVSFNINSIRARINTLLEFLDEHQPDVLGLQETKVQDDDFPLEPIADMGYEVYFHGQKTHYGVAILSNKPLQQVQKGYPSDDENSQKRLILGEYLAPNDKKIKIINGYFPQGENRDHPKKFPAKLKFYEDLFALLQKIDLKQESVIVMGDLNISPEDSDIGIGEQNAKRWLSSGKCSFLPEERELILKLKEFGLYDTFRELNPTVNDRFSWFDYRSKGFEDTPKRGLRIDQIWVTKDLLNVCVETGIDYETRGKEKPSDHCPIWADFRF